jgi:hypothetical protein
MLQRMRKASLVVLVTWVLSISASGADISGKWAFTVELDMGTGSPVFTFQQEGDRLTGTYSGAAGKADLTGSVKGNQVEWKFIARYEGVDYDVVYEGTIEPDNAMKGTCLYGGQLSGTWTAKRTE